MRRASLLFLLPLLLAACSQKEKEKTMFSPMDDTGIEFINKVTDTKDFNIFSYRNFYNGGGCAIGDINNDGLADVFFTANMGSNKLYLNKGDWKFEDISAKAGIEESGKWSTGVVMVDINNDSLLDIYVCNAGYQKGMRQENSLFINNGDLTFREAAREYGLANDGYTTHAAFFDYDADGDLDCYILNNSFIPVNTLNYSNKRELRAKDWPVADFLKGGGSYLLRNDSGKFTDVSEQAGIYGSLISFGLGVTVGDVNNDQYPDIYVSNDFFERDYLYINQKNGTFREELENWMQHISHSSMGADMADINNDGQPDIFVTEMLPDDETRLKTTTSFENIDVQRLKERSGFYHQFMQNTLQVNNGNGKFLETAFYSGVAASDWSWGGLIFDADNDGLNDIYICNGIYRDVTDQDFIDFFANDIIQQMVMTGKKEEVDQIIAKMPSRPIANKMLRNDGSLKFTDQANAWGMAEPSFSNGAAYGDLDNDGDLDLVVNNVNQPAFVYRNNAREENKFNYIAFNLQGSKDNLHAIGAKIFVHQANQVLMREHIPTRGFQSSVEYKITFGLGKNEADSVVVTWPGGKTESFGKLAINKLHTIREGTGKPSDNKPATEPGPSLFEQVRNPQFDKHVEDDYVDFYNERNIPIMLSREGPKAAVADVNGDGLDDIYIGGASRIPGQLYLQTSKGFIKKENEVFGRFEDMEDVAVLFFDADKDGDADLYIGSGGNNQQGSARMNHRLYRNDGKGNFTYDENSLPANSANIAVAVAHDVDDDGDLDLFVGARSVPLNYGVTPKSNLLINDGHGNFRDMASVLNPSLASLGMVTGAVWANVTGDKRPELVVVGDWMGPRIFSFASGKATEIKSNLSSMKGWWQSVAAADLDQDGFDDLVLGNMGENFYLRPDSAHPVKLWINDFDGNGNVEKVFTRTINDRDVPVFLKRELTDQLPSLKKQNLQHAQYASRSIQELFSGENIDHAATREYNYTSSCIAYGNKQPQFEVVNLPVAVQLSSVNAIAITDVNGDNKPDVLMGGNIFALQPQFCRLDASYGHLVLNEGNRKLTYLSNKKSGIQVSGAVRDLVPFQANKQMHLLVLQNSDSAVVYRYQNSPLSRQ